MAPRRNTTWFTLAAGLSLAGLSTGCYAEARTQPAYVEATYVPAHIEVYPSYHYEGRVVYLVGNRWYYREGPRWVYYRTEPQVLYRRRMVVRQAPPAPDPRQERRYQRYDDDHREGRRHEHDRYDRDRHDRDHHDDHRERRRAPRVD
jgi:hypothetical protein